MKFQPLATFTALLFLLLALVWLFFPSVQLQMWRVAPDASALLVGRRLAAWYLGVGVMFFIVRTAGPSLARTAMSAGMAVACLVVGALGLLDFVTSQAGFAILSAVAVEFGLAAAYFAVLRAERQEAEPAQG